MNARNTSSAPKTQTRVPGSRSTGSQSWKTGVLLAGLGATVLGWLAFLHGEQPAANGGISPQVSMSAEDEPLVRVEPLDSPRNPPTSVRRLPAMPPKPVFQVPVTRTRRS